MQKTRHLPIVMLLLVIAGAAGFGVYQWLAPTTGPKPADGMPVPQQQAALQPMTPEEGLNARYESVVESGSHKLDDWHGKVVLVNFWATWCAPCREEIPLLVKLQATYAAQGLQVVGIATDEVNPKDVKAYLGKMVVNYPMLMGDESVNRLVAGFGGNLIGLPYSLLLDRTGRVLKLYPGELDPHEAEAMVKAALNPPPTTSRLATPVPAPAARTKSRTTAK
jgi:thiol-disulfide isomerase/thioredoxin